MKGEGGGQQAGRLEVVSMIGDVTHRHRGLLLKLRKGREMMEVVWAGEMIQRVPVLCECNVHVGGLCGS